MSETYSTEELIDTLERTVINYHAGLYPDMKYIDEGTINAIIARLRAGDKLCEAAKSPAFRDGVIFCESNPQMKKLRKAIADYEGKEEK